MTSSGQVSRRDVVEAVAVRNLVRRQLGLEADPWELALVQRDLVWKEDGMAFLLDSLLARYPIGSLLLCQVSEGATDARPQGTLQGAEYRVEAMTPQLVDGQQRSYALFSLFTGKGHGRFYVDLKADWTRDAKYIAWRHGSSPVDDDQEVTETAESIPPDMRRHVDLSCFAGSDGPDLLIDTLASELTDDLLDSALAAINPEFEIPSNETERTDLLSKLNRIIAAWHEERIPVVTAVVEGPEDILELFTRVNRGGAAVSQNDLYFAAVKTFWHDPDVADEAVVSAKAALDRVVEASADYLNLWGALSLVSRLALAGLGEGDIVPLRVERLSRTNKNFIIRAIRTVAPIVAERIGPFVEVLRANSELKQALRFTHPHLWEDVLAWVVASNRTSWSSADVPAVESYLLGGTLFGYAAKLRDPYRRDAIRVCLDAGARGEAFPTASLRGAARHGSENLRRGRAEVLPSTSLQALARGHSAFVVAAAQGLADEEVGRVDWDHIIPDSWRGKLRAPARSGRRFLEEVRHINEPGNFWQIDFSANRIVQAAAPSLKFADLASWDPATTGRVSPDRHSGLTADHKMRFEAVGQELDQAADHESRKMAAARLAELIKDRNAWLVTRLYDLSIGPEARLFGADHHAAPVKPPPLPDELPSILGLAHVRAEFDTAKAAARRTKPAKASDAAAILGLAGVWEGLTDRLKSALYEVTLKHAKLSGTGVGEWVSANAAEQSLKRSVPLRPIEAGDRLELIVTGQRTAEGHPPFWARFARNSPNADEMWELLRHDGRLEISSFAGSPAVPIPVDPSMSWDGTRELIDEVFTHIRSVVETETDVIDA